MNFLLQHHQPQPPKVEVDSQVVWIQSATERSVLILFAVSELFIFIKWRFPGSGSWRRKAISDIVMAFLLECSLILWLPHNISFQSQNSLCVQTISSHSLATKYLPAMQGPKFWKGIDYVWISWHQDKEKMWKIFSLLLPFLGSKWTLKWVSVHRLGVACYQVGK